MTESKTKMKELSDQALALAGVYQAVYLTRQIARRGSADPSTMDASIRSLFKIDATDTEDVFGGLQGVETGLRQLSAQLSGRSGRDLELTRYLVSLMQLETNLSRHPELLEKIRSEIETAVARLEHFEPLHKNMLAQLADIYHSTISTLSPRIMVKGEPVYLNNPDNVNRIRSLLLAGIRATMLWRQCGGRRWRILVYRKQLLACTDQLIARLHSDADQGVA